MQGYKTVEEKACELEITPRHVQHLCRTGRVMGALKHAGVWFIPDDALIPIKNTKAGAKGFRFVGTKDKIFSCGIELFMLKGYQNVNLKDIADRVGIRQSTIYNHFKSKQEILDTIYDYYCYFYLKDRPSLEELTLGIEDKSVTDIIAGIQYEFKEEYKQRMADITRIIFQRISLDERAREIAKTLVVDEGITFVETVLDHAIEQQRFKSFNVHALALFINSIKLFTFYNWIVDPSPVNMEALAEDERALYAQAAAFLVSHGIEKGE